MTELTGIFLLAVFTEATAEYFVAPLLDKGGYSQYVKYVAAAVGIALCAAYQVDILAMLAGMTAVHPIVGWVVSGLIVGRGSNFLNDLVGLVRGDGGHNPEYRYRT